MSACQSPQMWPRSRRTDSTSSQCEITRRSCHAPARPAVADGVDPASPPSSRAHASASRRRARSSSRSWTGPRSPVAWIRSARTARERSAPPPYLDRREEVVTRVCRLCADFETARPRAGSRSSPSGCDCSRPGRRARAPPVELIDEPVRSRRGGPRRAHDAPRSPRRGSSARPRARPGHRERLTTFRFLAARSPAAARCRRGDPRDDRSCSEWNGSCWKSDSSQRSSASARSASASASPSRTKGSAARGRGTVERVGSPGGGVAMGRTGRIPRGAVERLEEHGAGGCSGAAVARAGWLRGCVSAIPAGALGMSLLLPSAGSVARRRSTDAARARSAIESRPSPSGWRRASSLFGGGPVLDALAELPALPLL